MKLYHPTTEHEEARILEHGFHDGIIPFSHDRQGRLSIRVGVGFADQRNGPGDGRAWVEIDVPDEIAEVFEDSDGSGVRYFYLPAALATYYLRKQ